VTGLKSIYDMRFMIYESVRDSMRHANLKPKINETSYVVSFQSLDSHGGNG